MLKRLCTLVLLLLVCHPATLVLADTGTKLLLIGDSLGASYGVPSDQGWARLLNQQLQADSQAGSVVNASISGDTTAGGLARLEPLLQQENPDWVLIELGGNDGLRGLNLKAMKSNLLAMIALSRKYHAKPVLIGIKLPPNYGRRYRESFEQIYVEVSNDEKVPLMPFLLDGVGGHANLMQEDRIHPTAEAQPMIRDNVWHFLQPLLGGSSASAQ